MLLPGNLCFVKVRGYSPWPARIDVLPKDVIIPRGKIPVFFYGTHEVSLVPETHIFEYEKYKDVYGVFKQRNFRFNDGMKELRENPNVLQLGFDDEAIEFLSQFYKFNKQSVDSISYKVTHKELKIDKEYILPKNTRKRRLSNSSDIEHIKENIAKRSCSILLNNCLEETNVKCINKADENNPNEKKREHVHDGDPVTSCDNKVTNKRKTAKLNSAYNEIVSKTNEVDKIEKDKEFDSDTNYIKQHSTKKKYNEIVSKTNTVDKIEKDKEFDSETYHIKQHSTKKKSAKVKESPIVNNSSKIYESNTDEILSGISEISYQEGVRKKEKFPKTESKYSDVENDLSDNFQNSNLESQYEEQASFKSPIENFDIYYVHRAKAMKLQEKFKLYLQEKAQTHDLFDNFDNSDNFNNSDQYNKVNTEKMPKRPKTSNYSKRKNEVTKIINQSQPVSQLPEVVTIKKEELDLRFVSELSVIDKEIKRSLIVGQEDHSRCMNLMIKLESLQNLNLISLAKVPEIIRTLRKCRRYKKEESIRLRASNINQKFYQIYDESDIEQKIEAGTELLKRDSTNLKSAQQLLDELFTPESKVPSCKVILPSLDMSSPSSAISHHSSSNNTPMMPPDHEFNNSEHIVVNICNLLKDGSLECIEVYEAKKEFKNFSHIDADLRNELELYKQLGV